MMRPNNRYNWKLKQFKIQEGLCCLCEQPMEFKETTLEHIIAQSRGGKSSKKNLALSHQLCNSRKASLDIETAKNIKFGN